MNATARQLEAMTFLTKSYSPAGAAAVVGNLSQEVGPELPTKFTLVTDHGSQGVAQWRLDRLTRLEKFAEDNHMIVTDLITQLSYLVWEAERFFPSIHQMLKEGTRSLANLTANFSHIYENPAKQYENLDRRIAYAQTAYDGYKPKPAGSVVVARTAVVAGSIGAVGAVPIWHSSVTWAAVVTGLAMVGILFGLWEHKRSETQPATTPALPKVASVKELEDAIKEVKDSFARVSAAEAVLLAERASGDKLLDDLKVLRKGNPNGEHA
jgi:Phage tail lysozyme